MAKIPEIFLKISSQVCINFILTNCSHPLLAFVFLRSLHHILNHFWCWGVLEAVWCLEEFWCPKNVDWGSESVKKVPVGAWKFQKRHENTNGGWESANRKIKLTKFWNTSKCFGFVSKLFDQIETFRFSSGIHQKVLILFQSFWIK